MLVAGGDGQSGTIASAELYDATNGTWSPTGALPIAVTEHTATLLSNGAVLATGGAGPSVVVANAEIYSPARGTWSSTGSLTSPRYSHTATLLPNGEVLIAAGAYMTPLASAELGVRVRQ